MAGRRRWSSEEILDAAAELLRTSDAESFSVRKLAATLGTDSSSLYRHFRSKTELLRAVADRILLAAMDGYHPEGDWKQRITALALRVREAFGQHPQLAAVWGRYASGGAEYRDAEQLHALFVFVGGEGADPGLGGDQRGDEDRDPVVERRDLRVRQSRRAQGLQHLFHDQPGTGAA